MHELFDSAGLVVDGESVYQRAAGFVHADDFDLRTLAPELEHHLVQCPDGGNVPKVRARHVDADAVSLNANFSA